MSRKTQALCAVVVLTGALKEATTIAASCRRACGAQQAAAGVSLAAHPTPAEDHVRFTNARISEVFQHAMHRSPSFRDLIASLDSMDRVVYVEEGRCLHQALHGCLVLTATPGGRYLLVRIDPRQPIRTVVALLAHELYHAAEVAREPFVVDAASLRSLYERIGEHGCFGREDECWETEAARTFEALVLRELTHSRTEWR